MNKAMFNGLMACLFVLVSTAAISAQTDEAKLIAEVYEKTKTAKTAADYNAIIQSCDKGLSLQTLSQNNKIYLNSLKAWALDLRGLQRVEVIELLQAAKNPDQAKRAFDQSMEDLRLAAELDPKRWQISFHRGVLQASMGEYEKAIDDFSSAIAVQPKETSPRFNRAECLYQSGEYEKALVDYQKVLEVSPGDVQAITGQAHCLTALGRTEESIKEYNVVIKFQQGKAWPLANRGDAYAKSQQWSLAYKDYNACLLYTSPSPRDRQKSRMPSSA